MASPLPLDQTAATPSALPALAEKVAFLSSTGAYGTPTEPVIAKETHMSWVFLSGQHVYKLKKPVRCAYLDFSSLAKRREACIAEWTLNRRLAPDIYLGVATGLARGQTRHER
jgi:uncharacterized protein